MATLATILRRFDSETMSPVAAKSQRAEPDPYRLRELPNEDIFFYVKRVDNSRLVREADPRTRRQCWSAIGAACAVVLLLTAILMPGVANTMAGYKISELKAEEQRLLDERRVLELEEARLVSPVRLQELARQRALAPPASDQVVHLDPARDGSLALNVK
jgi:hypothetical protein